jgi:parallel beta-helix repeat protein
MERTNKYSNNNIIQGNTCTAPEGGSAFVAGFATGNWFLSNEANSSTYGFWLGYSHDGNRLRGNTVGENTWGIQIEHGQNNEIFGTCLNAAINNASQETQLVVARLVYYWYE